MVSLLLLIFLFAVWCLWAVAATVQVAVENALKGTNRGMSVLPVIPIFPVALWGISFLWKSGPLVIGSLHGLYAVVLIVSIVRDGRRLRGLKRAAASPSDVSAKK